MVIASCYTDDILIQTLAVTEVNLIKKPHLPLEATVKWTTRLNVLYAYVLLI